MFKLQCNTIKHKILDSHLKTINIFFISPIPYKCYQVVQLKNGHFGVQKSMTVTITCDHRHIYGADAAEFLKDLAGK